MCRSDQLHQNVQYNSKEMHSNMYKKMVFTLQTSVFDLFLLVFAEPFSILKRDLGFLLVFVKRPT